MSQQMRGPSYAPVGDPRRQVPTRPAPQVPQRPQAYAQRQPPGQRPQAYAVQRPQAPTTRRYSTVPPYYTKPPYMPALWYRGQPGYVSHGPSGWVTTFALLVGLAVLALLLLPALT